MTQGLAALAAYVHRRRRAVLAAWGVLIGLAAAGLPRLDFNDDVRVWFDARNPQLQAFEALERTYGRATNVFIVLAPAGGDVFAPEALAAVAWLTDEAWRLPHARRVASLTNFQHSRAEGDTLVVAPLLAPGEVPDAAAARRIRRVALAEPLLVDRLVSRRGDVTGVLVTVAPPEGDDGALHRIMAAVEALVGRLRQRWPDTVVHVTGTVPLDVAYGEATRDDLTHLAPAMFLVIALTTAVLLRSVWGALAAMTVIGAAALLAMGLAGWLGVALDPASGNAPTVILTLAVADSVHLLSTFFLQRRRAVPVPAALSAALVTNFRPVLLTSLTTAIGFLSMNFSEAPPFRALGNLVALGVVFAFLLSVTLLPALMGVLPGRPPARRASAPPFDGLARWVVRHDRFLLWGMLALALGLMSGIPRIELNDDFIRYLDERYAVRRASDFVEARLTGMDAVDYELRAAGPGGIAEPHTLRTVDAFAGWLRAQPGVVHVNSITDLLKRLNRNLHGDDPRWYRLPESRALAAQYLLLYEMSLPYGQDLGDRINLDKSATRLTVALRGQDARSLRALDARARDWLQAHAPPAMRTRGTGLSLMFAHISQRNIRAMLGATLAALVLISAILVVALRSLRYGALSLVPNLAPAFMMFGLWGLTVGELGLAGSVLAAVTLGIVVDDTIHVIHHYLEGRRRRGCDPAGAVVYAFHTVGHALWGTTVILTLGFSTLGLSAYRVLSDMGVIAAGTIVLALLLDFFLLPALLVQADRPRTDRSP